MDAILTGMAGALAPINVAFVVLGVTLGIIVGAIPGLSAPMAVAIGVPLTYAMGPVSAIAFLLGIHKGGEYGGSLGAVGQAERAVLNVRSPEHRSVVAQQRCPHPESRIGGICLGRRGAGFLKQPVTIEVHELDLLFVDTLSIAVIGYGGIEHRPGSRVYSILSHAERHQISR